MYKRVRDSKDEVPDMDSSLVVKKRKFLTAKRSYQQKQTPSRSFSRFRGKRVTSCIMFKSLSQGFPDRYFTKIRFVTNVTLPGQTGGGNMACGFGGNFLHLNTSGPIVGANQLSGAAFTTSNNISGLSALLYSSSNTFAPYNNYRIHSSACDVRIANNANTASNAVMMALVPISFQNALITPNVNAYSVAVIGEQPLCKTLSISGSSVNELPVLWNGIGTRRVFGLKYKSAIENVEYEGNAGVNPTAAWFWYLLCDPITTTQTAIEVVVTVTYSIELFNRMYSAGIAF